MSFLCLNINDFIKGHRPSKYCVSPFLGLPEELLFDLDISPFIILSLNDLKNLYLPAFIALWVQPAMCSCINSGTFILAFQDP